MGAFAVVFGLLSIYVQIMDYTSRKKIYDEEVIKEHEVTASARVYSELKNPILIPPNPLSIFAKGVDATAGGKIEIALLKVPGFENTAQKKNPFLDIFDTFDVTVIVHLLFSVMTLFLVADSIAGEREEGTLKQTFANSVMRSRYFLSKYLGSLIILVIPLTILFLLAGLIIRIHPLITMTGTQWLAVFMIYLCSAAFISIYVLIGLCISAKVHTASLSSLVGLLVWIVLVFIYPNATRYAVNSFVPVASQDVVEEKNAEITTETIAEMEEAYPEQPEGGRSYSWASTGEYSLMVLIGVTQKKWFEYHLACNQAGIPIMLAGQERIYQAAQQFKRQDIRQQKIAAQFVRFLPGNLLSEASSKVAGTHYTLRDVEILDNAKQYRSIFLDYIRSKGGFGYAFFTQMPPDAMRETYAEYTDEIVEQYSPNNYEPLNLDDMPVYQLKTASVIPQSSLIDLISLILINAVLFITGGLLFSRSDLRNRN